MAINNTKEFEKKVYDYLFHSSSSVIQAFGNTHKDKRTLIMNAPDMNTEEKLHALDENDYHLLWKIVILGGFSAYVGMSVYLKKPVDFKTIDSLAKKMIS